MRRLAKLLAVGWACAACLHAAPAATDEAPLPEPEEVRQRMLGRLDGLHFSSRVRLAIDRPGLREERIVEVWRDDEGASRERLMIRFLEPGDMRGMGLLYIERTRRSNDYFLYQPSLRRVRRIPETLAREDVYGVDLEYLGFGAAQLEPTRARSVRWETVGEQRLIRLRETALEADARFDDRTVWLDPESYVPLQTEHRKEEKVTLVGRTLVLEERGGIPTPVRARFERPQERETVEMTVEAIDYESPIPEAFFSTLQLVKER